MTEQTIIGATEMLLTQATVMAALNKWFRDNAPGLMTEKQSIISVTLESGGYGAGQSYKVCIGEVP